MIWSGAKAPPIFPSHESHTHLFRWDVFSGLHYSLSPQQMWRPEEICALSSPSA